MAEWLSWAGVHFHRVKVGRGAGRVGKLLMISSCACSGCAQGEGRHGGDVKLAFGFYSVEGVVRRFQSVAPLALVIGPCEAVWGGGGH